MTSLSSGARREPRGARLAFWAYAAIGVLAMSIAWCWFGLAVFEEASDRGKALAAGTSMDGFAATVGGIPLAVAHAIGLVLLLTLGWRVWRARGLALGLAGVVAASLIGLGVAQLIFEGRVFDAEQLFIP